jgi:signal transduction histidine kinase
MTYPSQSPRNLLNRTLQGIVLIYQLVAVLVFAASLYLASDWLTNPFIGGFFEHTFILNGSNTVEEGKTWAMYAQGFELGDQLLAVDGAPVTTSAQLRDILGSHAPGDQVTVTMRRTDGTTITAAIILQQLSPADRYAYFYIPEFLGVIFLISSLWIFGLRRTDPAGRAFSVFTSSLAIGTCSLFDLYTSHQLTHLWTLAVALIGGSLIDLSLGFPREVHFAVGRPYVRWVGYLAAFILTFNAFPTLFNFQKPAAYFAAWQSIYAFVGFSAIIYFGMLLFHSLTSFSPVVKSQARAILAGSLVSFGPLAAWLLFQRQSFNPYLLPFLLVFPLVNGYVVLRFRLLRTDFWVRRGLVYALLTTLIVLAYGFMVSGVALILPLPPNNPYLIGALVLLIATTFNPLRDRLQTMVDSVFFRGQRAYEERLRAFSQAITSAADITSIGRVIREQVTETLMPDRLHIFIYDALTDQYAALPGEDGRPTSDIRFSSTSPLVQYFQKENIPLYLDTINPPTLFKGDQARLSLLGARLFIRLQSEGKTIGWLALGTSLSGAPYTPQDLDYLESIASQASLAVSRIQTVANLERRVQEMNALSLVSQGVNVTLTFDDVLELIFAQTTRIIPSDYFHICLYDKAANYYYYAFRVDDNERIKSLENQPLPSNFGLGQEIIRRGRSLITQDYRQECQIHNITPSSSGIYAWMGVPLNSESGTIGSLSVGSRDPTVTYTRAQLELLQAIADQTVGAIVKARLLQETEQRAHQLATLNEITRQLTSTLEQEPLLRNILDNAVKILNCEAGTLFLMDEQTGELIFRVTTGPVAGNLLGQRLPPGTGIAGRAAQTRSPIIENDAQKSPSRFSNTDRQTGFVSRSLLAVPMQVKDRVLGVIEVINRRDGLPFVEDDQNILTAFAGQAAVAIENARLLALTDQELTARLDELQVMGRIVRELNASLDVDRAMRTTLEWAMRQSNAEAGLIGMLEGNRIRLMAQEGYEGIFTDPSNGHLPLDNMPTIQSALASGQPCQISLIESNEKGLLPAAHTQIIVPIRRETEVIGLLLLESMSDSHQNLQFLNRLSDNAAIAIYNAQLYAEVQRANDAKSDFVSFVAHELKNPMTSIKGYTELLAGGAVGPINEMQTNFLNTIRSNVERMSVLVSDLNDNAKIEAGRLRLDFKAVNIRDVLEDVLRSTRRQIEDKKQTVQLHLAEPISPVWADPVRVGQVLTNLVSNAHKYTPEGGQILIGAEEAENQWDPEGAPRVVHLWVKDNGIGISIEDQAKIFQKFFRSDDSKAREAPGTGLGLNITKSLVEMQGGRIWFESEFRRGTTFHFTVPVAEG